MFSVFSPNFAYFTCRYWFGKRTFKYFDYEVLINDFEDRIIEGDVLKTFFCRDFLEIRLALPKIYFTPIAGTIAI